MSEIILNNKMSAEYNLMGEGNSYIQLDVIVGNYYENDLEIIFEVRGSKTSQITMNYEIVYSNSSSIVIEYTPFSSSIIGIEYEINPHNSMKVKYDLQLPPTIEIVNFSVQDSFVASIRPYSILNYGNNISMLVGQDHKGDNISYVKFDTSNVPSGVVIRTAKIRLYYTQFTDNQDIGIYRVKENWSEYGITYNNIPSNDEFLTNEYTNNPDEFYIEFDVSNIASQWIDGLSNDGVSLKSSEGLSVFRTKEHSQPPKLIIEYYSPTSSILASSRISTEFYVVEMTDNSIELEYEVHSDFRFTEIQLDYFVKAQNDIFDEFIELEYEITQVPFIQEDSTIVINYKITFDNFDYIDFEFEVAIYEDDSDINIDYLVQLNRDSIIELEFEIIKQESSNEISIEFIIPDKDSSNIDIEYNIFGLFDSIIELEFEVSSYEQNSSIEIEYYTTAYRESSIELEFEVNLADSESDITLEYIIRELTDNNIDISYDIVVEGFSEIEFEFGIIGYSDSSIELEYLPRVEFLDVIEIEYDVNEYLYYAYVYVI